MTPIEDDGVSLLKAIEFAGRNCYASQDKITEDSYIRFCCNLLNNHHETPLEFADLTVDITTSRSVLAEITRHRLASFCVESQRYIQESKTGDITFIYPEWVSNKKEIQIDDEKHDKWFANISGVMTPEQRWLHMMYEDELAYKAMIADGKKPEEAREILPNSTACRIIMKANIREWRHIFELRTSPKAYPQMRSLMNSMLKEVKKHVPIVFDDIDSNSQ